MNLDIGDFGLALTLRLEIDDANDIPIIPRLLYSIKNDEGSILTWFIQKRVGYALQLPGQGINQQLASGVSDERWVQIKNEVNKSIFGNAVNFPFSAAKAVWPETQLSFDSTLPVKTKIPTLFITGILDCRTPVEQVDNIMEGFANASHIKVENAGHEQAQWDIDVADKIIPAFIQGENIESGFESYSKINFIKLTGEVSGHPSIN